MPLPIEEAQIIFQPYIFALMAELMEIVPGDRMLEVDTGSGYAYFFTEMKNLSQDFHADKRYATILWEVRTTGATDVYKK